LRVRLSRLRPVRNLRFLWLELRRVAEDGIRESSRDTATDAGSDGASPGREMPPRRLDDESRPEGAT
jgi:hypothetical protein